MNLLNKKLECFSNVAIIFVAVLICLFFVRDYLFENKSPTSPPIKKLPNGTKVNLLQVDFSKNDKTICVLLQPSCHFCSESRPLYQKLATATAQAKKTKLVMILPDFVPNGKSFLAENNIPYNDLIQIPLKSLGINVTPYLFVVDQSGVVIDSWAGKLKDREETKLLSMIE